MVRTVAIRWRRRGPPGRSLRQRTDETSPRLRSARFGPLTRFTLHPAPGNVGWPGTSTWPPMPMPSAVFRWSGGKVWSRSLTWSGRRIMPGRKVTPGEKTWSGKRTSSSHVFLPVARIDNPRGKAAWCLATGAFYTQAHPAAPAARQRRGAAPLARATAADGAGPHSAPPGSLSAAQGPLFGAALAGWLLCGCGRGECGLPRRVRGPRAVARQPAVDARRRRRHPFLAPGDEMAPGGRRDGCRVGASARRAASFPR